MKRRNAILTAVSCIALVACAGNAPLQGYAGPPRPVEETILVYGERPSSSRLAAKIIITAYDTPIGELVPVATRQVRLLPGENCILAEATTSTMDQEEALMCFDAQEGREYEIRVLVRGVQRDLFDSLDGRRTVEGGPFRIERFMIVDASSAEIVAAHVPIAAPESDSD